MKGVFPLQSLAISVDYVCFPEIDQTLLMELGHLGEQIQWLR